MFLAFNKDAIGGKSFQEFGKSMEAKYGHAKEVYRDDKTRGGVIHKLDHYEWSAGGGERLRLIDRSEFYGVYCLVLYDGGSRTASTSGARSSTPARRSRTSWSRR